MESDSGYSTVNVRPWVTWLLPAGKLRLWWEPPHSCGEGALQRSEKQSRLDHAL